MKKIFLTMMALLGGTSLLNASEAQAGTATAPQAQANQKALVFMRDEDGSIFSSVLDQITIGEGGIFENGISDSMPGLSGQSFNSTDVVELAMLKDACFVLPITDSEYQSEILNAMGQGSALFNALNAKRALITAELKHSSAFGDKA